MAEYFEALSRAEHLLGLRVGTPVVSVRESDLPTVLHRELAIMSADREIQQHVRPVLDQIDTRLKRLQRED